MNLVFFDVLFVLIFIDLNNDIFFLYLYSILLMIHIISHNLILVTHLLNDVNF
jgi:hypothetical protein